MPPYPVERVTGPVGNVQVVAAPGGPLTPRPGYALRLTQVVGERPRILASCLRCEWVETVPFDALDVADPAGVGTALLEGVRLWMTHAQAARELGLVAP